jgi:hypothetical protein
MALQTKQRILFTALPRGINPDTGRYRVSAFVTPRLVSSSGQLGEFPDWEDWPATVQSRIEWRLLVSAAGQTYQPTLTITSPAPSSEAWAELFSTGDTRRGAGSGVPLDDFVGPQQKSFSDRLVISYPDKSVGDYFKDKLTQLASNPNEPAVDAARSAYPEIDLYDPDRDELDLDEQLAEIIDQLSERGSVRSDPGRPDLGLAEALLLNEPTLAGLKEACEAVRSGAVARTRAAQVRGGTPPVVGPPEPPKLDFHKALSAAAAHPHLMRMLGLIVDFEFEMPTDLLGEDPQSASISFRPKVDYRTPRRKIASTPRVYTRCLVSLSVFEAEPFDFLPATESGLLRLSDQDVNGPRYALSEIDTQGSAMKMAEYMTFLGRLARPGFTGGFGFKHPPPVVRSAGISVTQVDRAFFVYRSNLNQANLNQRLINGTTRDRIDLYRDDVTRGFVFDVFDVSSSRWYSLCRRIGRARFGEAADDNSPEPLPGDVTWEDEGWVSAGISTSSDPADTIQRVTDTFASWANGWSMVTQRPGKSVNPDEVAEDYEPEVGDFKLAVRYAVKPGSLPPQRFGRTYRVRGRAVDLAGNVLTSDDASALQSPHVLEMTYRRWEPVAPPTVLMRKQVTEGESPDLLVIRSNFGTAPASTSPSDRHIFPPSFDQFRSECHGMFDVPGGIRPDFYDEIAARENGAFDARDSSGNFIHPNAQSDPLNYGAPYFDVDTPQFEVEGGSLARMPSLPDPMCGGLAFVGLPGVPSSFIEFCNVYRSGATWPNVRPVRLRIFESANFVPPVLSGDELRVGLPKAESFSVNLSAYLTPSILDHMALYERLPDQQQEIRDGQNWAVTPTRPLRLVHAVRQPLVPTNFANLLETRRPNDTSILLEDTMTTSRKSTERVEIYADWVETTDYLPEGVDELHEPERWEPERQVPVSSKVLEQPIDLDGPDGTLPISVRHELHSTRHIRAINYSTVATTRFKEYFTERAEVTLPRPTATATLPSAYTGPAAGTQAVVVDSERVTSLDGKKTYERSQPGERGGSYTMDYEAGTISRVDTRLGRKMPTQVRVTYIKREITRSSLEATAKRALSTRRPDPPKILYAMPTFTQISSDQGPNSVVATREVNGLRVFLDRPWWSSGDGELLGVILPFNSGTGGAEHLVTRRGKDPIWAGDNVTEVPSLDDFPAAVDTRNGLTVPGGPPGAVFTVAGHEVKPDLENLRWYCDIDINLFPEPYTPFYRFALARYQPHSVAGLELSPIVQLDYMQLYPDRYASVFRFSESSANVYVSGATHRGGKFKGTTGSDTPGGTVIVAQVEKRRPGLENTTEMFGWIPVPGVKPVQLSFDPNGKGGPNWSGNVDVSTGGNLRVAIREYEQFGPKVGIGTGRFQRRLVYAEAINVPPPPGDT